MAQWSEYLFSPQIPMLKSSPVMTLGGRGFGRWLGHEDRTLMKRMNALTKQILKRSFAPSIISWGHRKKLTICHVEEDLFSTEHKEAGNLILDFWPTETVSKKSLLLISHQICGYCSLNLKQVVYSIFIRLCGHHYIVPEYLQHPERNNIPNSSHLLFSPMSPSGQP